MQAQVVAAFTVCKRPLKGFTSFSIFLLYQDCMDYMLSSAVRCDNAIFMSSSSLFCLPVWACIHTNLWASFNLMNCTACFDVYFSSNWLQVCDVFFDMIVKGLQLRLVTCQTFDIPLLRAWNFNLAEQYAEASAVMTPAIAWWHSSSRLADSALKQARLLCPPD